MNQPAQEEDRVASRTLVVLFVVGVLVTLGTMWASSALLSWRREALGRPRPAVARHDAPRVIGMLDQTLIARENRGGDVRASQSRVLARWGWVDRDAGIARMPIERAMDLVVARADAGSPP